MSSDSILSGISLKSLIGKNQSEFLYLLKSLSAAKTNPSKTSATSSETSNEDELIEVDDSELAVWGTLSDNDKKAIFNALDTDSSGTLSEEEVGLSSGVDGNSNDLTIKDLTELFKTLGIETTENAAVTTAGAQRTSSSSHSNNNSKKLGDTDDSTTPQTLEEIKTAITQKEADKADTLQQEKDGVTNYEQQMMEYLTQEGSIPADVLAKYQQDNAAIDESIALKKQDIATKTGEIQDLTAKISSLTTSITSLGNQENRLKSELAAAQSSTDETVRSEASDIQKKLDNIKNEKETKEDDKKQAESDLAKAQQDKTTYEQDLQNLEQNKTDLKTKLMQDAQSASEEAKAFIEKAQTAINELKTEAASLISQLDTEISELKTKATALEETEKTDKVISENSILNSHNAKGLYESMGLEEKGLSLQVFSDALEGYNNLEDKGNGMLAIFDTTQSANAERYYLFNMNTGELVEQSKMKTGSGNMGNIETANRSGSGATLSGFEMIGEEYYSSKMGKRAIRIIGLEEGINDNSLAKGTVFHYTQYNHTLGCLGFPPVKNSNGSVNKEATYARMRELAPTGTIVYVQPTDPDYKKKSKLL